MPGRWRIADPFEGWTIVDVAQATPADMAAALSAAAAVAALDRLVALGPAGRTTALRSAATWFEPGLVGAQGAAFPEYKRILLAAAAAGELLVLRRQLTVKTGASEPPAPAGDGFGPPAEQPQDWVEVTVTTEDGEPYTGAYRIELPDGRVVSGRLNMGGTARLDGIPSGSCKVSFPEVDQPSSP